MKRKLLSLLLAMTMGMSLLVGCGASDKDTSVDSNLENESNVSQDTGKDDVTEDTTEEKDEIDTNIYSEKIELTTAEGKTVWVYYDPTIVECIAGEDWRGEYCVDLGEMLAVAVTDSESAKAYVDAIISNNGRYLEIGVQEEISLGGYTVHHFRLNDIESGSFAGEEWVIELDSGVVFTFNTIIFVEEDGPLNTELNAIKFVVE